MVTQEISLPNVVNGLRLNFSFIHLTLVLNYLTNTLMFLYKSEIACAARDFRCRKRLIFLFLLMIRARGTITNRSRVANCFRIVKRRLISSSCGLIFTNWNYLTPKLNSSLWFLFLPEVKPPFYWASNTIFIILFKVNVEIHNFYLIDVIILVSHTGI